MKAKTEVTDFKAFADFQLAPVIKIIYMFTVVYTKAKWAFNIPNANAGR